MSKQTTNIKVLTKPGEWIPGFNAFVAKGKTVTVDAYLVKHRLQALPTFKERFEIVAADAKVDVDSTTPAVLDSKQQAAKAKASKGSQESESSEIWKLEFPSREQLVRGGVLSVDGLHEFVASNGDAWFKQIEGMDATKAKAVTDYAAKLKKK